MTNSYGQFTGWVSVSDILKSEPSCTSHKPRASFQRWQVGGDLVHGKCPYAATQSYVVSEIDDKNINLNQNLKEKLQYHHPPLKFLFCRTACKTML